MRRSSQATGPPNVFILRCSGFSALLPYSSPMMRQMSPPSHAVVAHHGGPYAFARAGTSGSLCRATPTWLDPGNGQLLARASAVASRLRGNGVQCPLIGKRSAQHGEVQTTASLR